MRRFKDYFGRTERTGRTEKNLLQGFSAIPELSELIVLPE